MKNFDKSILFKQSELGLLPSSWKVERLGSLTSHIIDCLHEKKPDFIDEGDKIYFEVYNIGKDGFPDLTEINHVTDEVYNNWIKRLKPQHRDIVISKTGRVGAVTILPYGYNFCIGRNQVLIRTESTKILPEFLLLYLYSSNFKGELKRLTTDGTILKSLHVKYISQIRVPLPDIDEQKAIVEIVYSLMIKIKNNEEMNLTLDSFAHSLFLCWFVRFDPFRDGEFEESELGKIPKGWKIITNNDLGKIYGGGTPSTKKREFWGGKILFATPTDVTRLSSPFLIETERKITESGLANCSSKLHPKNSILITSRATIGFVCINYRETSTNQGFIIIRPYKEELLYFILNHIKHCVPEIIAYAGGSTYREINKTTFKALKLIYPSDNLLTKFHNIVKPLYERVRNNVLENQTLKTLRDSLLQQLFSGRLRVPNPEKFLVELNELN